MKTKEEIRERIELLKEVVKTSDSEETMSSDVELQVLLWVLLD